MGDVVGTIKPKKPTLTVSLDEDDVANLFLAAEIVKHTARMIRKNAGKVNPVDEDKRVAREMTDCARKLEALPRKGLE